MRLWLILLVCLVCAGSLVAQDPPKKKASQDGTTILGTVSVPAEYAEVFQAAELPLQLLEDVFLPPLPIPENWQSLSAEEQNKWWSAFQESAEGKAFFADRQQRMDNAKTFNVRIEPNGDFKVYDIPPGRYQLYGVVNKKIKDVEYAFQVFGALEVAPQVDEMVVGKLDVVATPLWVAGQAAPPLEGKTLDDKPFELKSLAGQHVLVVFWMIDGGPALQFQKALWENLQQQQPSQPVILVSACMETNVNRVKEVVAKAELPGQVIVCGPWDGKVARDYGLSQFPSLWLIGPDQKFKMTDAEFEVARIASQLSLPQIVAKLAANEPIPNYPPEPKSAGGGEKSDK